MKLQSGERLLTIKDIARRIAYDRTEEGIARTMRQIRHWTQNDLLKTASEKETGKGVPRFYDEEPTIQIAAILQELCRYGVTVDILKFVATELYDHWDDDGMYIHTSLTDINSFLQLACKSDPITGNFVGAEIHMFDEMGSDEHGEIDPEPTSSILINMTQVMGRVLWGDE